MPYCPNCETEFRDGILRCSDCGTELVQTLAAPQADEDGAEAVELVELASFPIPAEADMMRELLETNGIRTVVRGESDPIGAASMASPAALLVEQRDLERARELYDAFFAGEDAEAGTPSADGE